VSRYVESGGPHWLAVANSASYAGGFGVDLFFVLSAYLITELLLREKSQCGTLDVKAFYLRRVLRIWPLYFFYIGIALIPAFNPVKEFSWRYVLAFLLLAGNWSILLWGWPHSIINPLWTVSVEEQFYLLWPPLVRNIPRNKIIFAAVGMLVVSTVTRILLVAFHAGTDSVRCNTLGRLDPIAAGILIAAMLHRAPNFSNGLRLGMLSCGVLPLVLVAHYWKIQDPRSLMWIPTLVGFPVVAASCTLILLAVLGVSVRFPRILTYLGKISYGLYVYSALAAFLASKLIPSHRFLRQLILRELLALIITILFAAVSYTLLEKPFLRLKARFELIRSRPA